MKFGHFDDKAKEYVITTYSAAMDQLSRKQRFFFTDLKHLRRI